ncbi:hypothetical protein ABH940_003217 [Streptacidiphilus sp. BW17]|uniref:hypothetical protein n=1 Tax=unclassified Streptacidiphilus TaxID=2643834 RepID=UPI0035194EAE
MAKRKTFDPGRVPVSFWRADDVQSALARHEVGALFQLYLRQFPDCTQTQLALLTEHDRSEISNWIRGVRAGRVSDIDVLTRIADGLQMPDEARVLTGLAPASVLMSSVRTAVPASRQPAAGELPADMPGGMPAPSPTNSLDWREDLRRFWGLAQSSRVDIVCSEIPEQERPYFASPQDRNYLRYAKFADLDSLIYVRTRLTQLHPDLVIRDFSPSEYFDTGVDTLVVVGGPPWNAKYREFLPQLPFYFAPNPLGEDDPLVVPQLGNLALGPQWSPDSDLLEDIAVFTRLTMTKGTTVFLLGGCLTLGVLGGAQCFLHGERAAANARWLTELIGDDDFVLVTDVRRLGGIADLADLTATEPLLVLARHNNDPFSVVVKNTDRYGAV